MLHAMLIQYFSNILLMMGAQSISNCVKMWKLPRKFSDSLEYISAVLGAWLDEQTLNLL